MAEQNLLATIDLGSNSFRLLVAKVDKDNILIPLDQIRETVRLAAGLDENNRLQQEAIVNALKVIERFAERLTGFNQSQVRAVATSTLRIASNAMQFIEQANKILGFNIEIISGVEEARLIYIGAMHSLAYTEDKRLVVDIGGGSTEFIIGTGYEPIIMESVTMGCVSFSNHYFAGGALTEENFASAIFAARSKVQTMEHFFLSHNWSIAIGTSGTAHSLYDLCVAYVLVDAITLDALHKIKKTLIKNKNIKHVVLPGIKEDRKPVIAGGLAIMIAIMQELHITSMTIADGALREGVMYDMVGRKDNHDLRIITVAKLKTRYEVDQPQGELVAKVAIYIYRKLIPLTTNDGPMLKLFQWALELYEIGLAISHSDYHKHGAYILEHADLVGFSKPEQTMLADLVRAHRGNLSKAITSLSSRRKLKNKILYMVMAFRFAVILCRRRGDIAIKDVGFEIIRPSLANAGCIELVFNPKWLQNNPLTYYGLVEEVAWWRKVAVAITIKHNN